MYSTRGLVTRPSSRKASRQPTSCGPSPSGATLGTDRPHTHTQSPQPDERARCKALCAQLQQRAPLMRLVTVPTFPLNELQRHPWPGTCETSSPRGSIEHVRASSAAIRMSGHCSSRSTTASRSGMPRVIVWTKLALRRPSGAMRGALTAHHVRSSLRRCSRQR